MYTDLLIDQITPNPNQPRKFFDEGAHRELTESIKENGLLQPVVVRAVEGEEVPHMIVAGERRWRACKEAGLTTIPVRILEDVDEEKAFVLSISENVNRADMTIMEEAGAYADLVALGWKPEAIAKTFGKTKTHIEWRLGLLTLRPEVAEWVNEGKIKPNLSWHIAQLSPAHQMVAANRYLKGDFDSEADAANFAQGLRMAEQQTSLVSEKEPDIEEKEKRQKAKAKTTDKLGRLEEVVMPLLEELTKSKPEELADILGTDLGRYVRKIDRLANQVTLARRILRQANGIAEAREVAWNSAAAEVQEEKGKAKQSDARAEQTQGGKVEQGKTKGGEAPKVKRAEEANPAAKKVAAKPRPTGTRGRVATKGSSKVPAQKKAEPAARAAKETEPAPEK
ncbi:ParB/RepB/Spo0J family partition protein [Streptomyces noursei]|uniref:ParB/RepB/Spo0J family partition protein n=1 Tax=Streptomyces noursei TaxID=1971 RepID=UPI00045EE246|nr:ParB/RepB/Spo0J family partition protein [Streptomyces noursei]AIA03481.1 chromosome partitioning protein ParB [Streptomyces noursei]